MKLLNVISLGAGVQSSALLIASDRGLRGIPRADMAIFADTQDEPAWVYEQLEALRRFVRIPIGVVTAGRLSAPASNRSLVPLFVDDANGMLLRKCTTEYKIIPIQREIRRLLGLAPRERSNGHVAQSMIGISTDEAHRMRPSRVPYIANAYPLIDAGMNRFDCVQLLEAEGVPVPRKSACVFCPYHGDRYWLELKRDYPQEWRRAVEYDAKIRDLTGAGVSLPAYVHRSCKPLEQVDLNESQTDLFGNECEGMCGN